jgi:hypothetical protein
LGSFPLNSKNNNISQFSIILNNEASVLDSLFQIFRMAHKNIMVYVRTTLNITLHDYYFWLRGARHLFYSYMCSWFRNVSRNQLNGSLDDFFTYIFTNTTIPPPYVSSIDLSYNQFSGNLMGLNGSGAFQTAVSLEVL